MKVACPTPKQYCTGSFTGTNMTLGKTMLAHGGSKESFECYIKYLVSIGYVKVGSREYRIPDTGYILLLTKKSKFGTPLRKGKGGETGTKGNRHIPRGKRPGLVVNI